MMKIISFVFKLLFIPIWGPFWILRWVGEKTGINAALITFLMATDMYLPFVNLTRKPLRLFLTLFAIFIAFLIHGILGAFMDGLNAGVELSADDRLITVNKINFTQPLPISYVRKVEGIEGIKAVTHLSWFGGYYQDPQQQVQTMAADEKTLLDVYGKDMILAPEDLKRWQNDRQGLLIGRKIADKFGWKVGDRIPLSSNIYSKADGNSTWEMDISAIYDGATPQVDTTAAYMQYEYFNETTTFGRDYTGFLGILTVDPAVNEFVIKAIDDKFANSPFETETVPEKVFVKQFLEQIGNISLILTSVVLAAFFIILVIVGNSMVLAIRERTSEIGVMKTLGFTSGRIFKMVLAESLLLSLLGGLMGLGLASFLIIAVINKMGLPLPDLLVSRHLVIEAVIIMAGLGFITGIIPATNALRLNIITALSRR